MAVLFLLLTQQLEQAFTSLSYYVKALDCLSAVVLCMLLDGVFLKYFTNYVSGKKNVTGSFV